MAIDRHPACIARTGVADGSRLALRPRPRPRSPYGAGATTPAPRCATRGRHRPLGDAGRVGRSRGRTACAGWCRSLGRRRPRDAGPRSVLLAASWPHWRRRVTLGGGIGFPCASTGSSSTTRLPPRCTAEGRTFARPPTNTLICSGAARRRRQLRRRHLVPIRSPPSARPCGGRLWAADDDRRGATGLRGRKRRRCRAWSARHCPPLPGNPEDTQWRWPSPSPAVTPALSRAGACGAGLRRFGPAR
jgi:hypothetical protein